MKQYLDLMSKILSEGHDHADRTGAGRRSIFGTDMRFKLSEGFPLVTTRFISTKAMIHELLWFIAGDTNTKNLEKAGVKIWSPWAVTREDVEAFVTKHAETFKLYGGFKEDIPVPVVVDELLQRFEGKIGPMYGSVWRNAPQANNLSIFRPLPELADIASDKLAFYKKEYESHMEEIGEDVSFEQFAGVQYLQTVDQLNELVVGLKRDPYSARHVVTAWEPTFVPVPGCTSQENVMFGLGSLAACHMSFQCFVRPPENEGGKKRLSLRMMQRSCDFPVGVPFNIAQYALLLSMLAHVTDMEADEFIWSGGDTHIYLNQLDQVKDQLSRTPKALPKLWLNPEVKDLFAFKFSDIRIEGYEYHEPIRYAVNV